MEAAIVIILTVLVVALHAISFVDGRRSAAERTELLAEMRRVQRQSMRAVMARNGLDFDTAEARGVLLEHMNDDPRPTREPDPPMEGLG